MKQFTLTQRLRYWFDNTMSRGPIALIGWLAVVSAALILVVALVVWLVAPEKEEGATYSFTELTWMSLMRTLDPGTMGGDEGTWAFLAAMLTVTLGGIFVVSILIGVITTGVEGKLEQLRKGRSLVVETGHTVILGWSDQVFAIISELVQANANRRRPVIVIMADQDKVEMEDAVRDKVGSLGTTRVVCRRGNPIDLTDLHIVNLQGSRSIIILVPDSEEPDAEVIKTILAITNNPQRRSDPYHIVAQIRDPKNLEAARLVGGAEAQLIESESVISRVIAQTCRQSGLSVVYTELMDFGGDEIYFQEEPKLVGKTFGDSLLAYEDSAIIGLQFSDGRVALNAPMDTLISSGDKVIAISEDDDTVRISGRKDLDIDSGAIQTVAPAESQPERTLVLGWNRRAPLTINELDNYSPPGSSLTVVADDPSVKEALARRCAGRCRQTLSFKQGDITDRATLEQLKVEKYQHVIVLSYSDVLDVQRADARTLITLLHLRDIESRTGEHFSIVSEMLDARNRELAEVTHADDFIVSDRIISLLLAQISENKDLNAVFTDIFDPEGSEIYLKPANDYVGTGKAINFYTVVDAARKRGHVAIGYRVAAESNNAARAHGVVVNPDKSQPVTFSDADRIIVLAEE